MYRKEMENQKSLLRKDFLSIALLDGDFESVFRQSLDAMEPTGWSYEFRREGIALFLLACYEGDYRTIPAALRKMFYFSGVSTLESSYGKWKQARPIPSELADQIMEEIQKTIRNVLDQVLGAQRDAYEMCADYVTACAEVMESRGDLYAVNIILKHCLSEYKRYRAFTPYLKAYLQEEGND
jgi:hypothetical protein